MKSLPEAIEVLIVGAGPVGMATANLLASFGVKGLVIDKEPDIFAQPRAISLDNEALRVLQWAGLDENSFSRIGLGSVRFNSPLFGEIARVNSAGSIDCHPKAISFFQPELEQALLTRLQKREEFSLHRGVSLLSSIQTEKGVQATLEDECGNKHELHCQFLIAADGANSSVRKSLGLDFKGGKQYDEDWLIVDVKGISKSNIKQPIDHVEFICDPKRSVPHLPAPGDRERWEFKLRKNEDPKTLLQDENIRKLLLPWFPQQDANIERKAVYRFQANVAPKFSKGKIFLVGDAAHVTPPFIGQGLVAGLRDGANLSWKIASVLKGFGHEKILQSYDTERRPHAKAMIKLAVIAGRVVMPQNKLAAFISHGLVSLIAYLPFFKNLLKELEIKPENGFKKGLFVNGGNRIKRGHPLVQTELHHEDGRVFKSDDVLAGKFRLIAFGEDPHAYLSENALNQWKAFGGECLQVCHHQQVFNRTQSSNCWEDKKGTLLPGVAPLGWLAIVRPDQIVMHDGPLENAEQIVQEVFDAMGFSGQALSVQPGLSMNSSSI